MLIVFVVSADSQKICGNAAISALFWGGVV
jgi:hypothetical protein